MTLAHSLARQRLLAEELARHVENRYERMETTRQAAVSGRNMVSIDGQFYPAILDDTARVGTTVEVKNVGTPSSARYVPHDTGGSMLVVGGGGSGSGGEGGGGGFIHELDSIYHTGLLGWARLNFAGSDLADIATRRHTDLQTIGADDHHSKLHDIADPTVHSTTGSHLQLVGLVADDVVGLITPTSDGWTNRYAPLMVPDDFPDDAALIVGPLISMRYIRVVEGLYGTVGLDLELYCQGSLLNIYSNDRVHVACGQYLDFETNIQGPNYASRLTEWRITQSGEADFRYVAVDEMHAKSFIVELEQAIAGSETVTPGVGQLAANFTAPAPGGTATLFVYDLDSAPQLPIFREGDIVALRKFTRSGGSLDIANCWGVVTGYIDTAYFDDVMVADDRVQQWTFTRSVGSNAGAMVAGTVIAKDAIVLDYGVSGNGYVETNAVDGLYGSNAPYTQVVTWTGHPATGQTIRKRDGNLTGVGFTGEYGQYVRGVDSNQYIKGSGAGVDLRNVDLRLKNGSLTTVQMLASGNVKFGKNVAAAASTGFEFDAPSGDLRIGNSTGANIFFDQDTGRLIIDAEVLIRPGSGGLAYFSDAGNLATADTADFATQVSGATKPANNATVGAHWANNLSARPTELTDGRVGAGLNTSGNVSRSVRSDQITVNGVGIGLNLTGTHLGFWNGSAWRWFARDTGFVYYGSDTGAHLEWNDTLLKLRGVDAGGVEQWFASSQTGEIGAGANSVSLSAYGLDILGYDTLTPASTNRALAFWFQMADRADLSKRIAWLHTSRMSNEDVLTLTAKSKTAYSGRIYLGVDGVQRNAYLTMSEDTTGGLNRTTATLFAEKTNMWNTDYFRVYDGTTVRFQVDLATGLITLNGRFGSWTALGLQSGWANLGAGFEGLSYRKSADIVYVRGTVRRTSGTNPTIAFLPVGYRPLQKLVVPTMCTGNFPARFDLDTDGSMTLLAGDPASYIVTSFSFSIS